MAVFVFYDTFKSHNYDPNAVPSNNKYNLFWIPIAVYAILCGIYITLTVGESSQISDFHGNISAILVCVGAFYVLCYRDCLE